MRACRCGRVYNFYFYVRWRMSVLPFALYFSVYRNSKHFPHQTWWIKTPNLNPLSPLLSLSWWTHCLVLWHKTPKSPVLRACACWRSHCRGKSLRCICMQISDLIIMKYLFKLGSAILLRLASLGKGDQNLWWDYYFWGCGGCGQWIIHWKQRKSHFEQIILHKTQHAFHISSLSLWLTPRLNL